MTRREQHQRDRDLAAKCFDRLRSGTVHTYEWRDGQRGADTTDLEIARLARRVAMLDYTLKQVWC